MSQRASETSVEGEVGIEHKETETQAVQESIQEDGPTTVTIRTERKRLVRSKKMRITDSEDEDEAVSENIEDSANEQNDLVSSMFLFIY